MPTTCAGLFRDFLPVPPVCNNFFSVNSSYYGMQIQQAIQLARATNAGGPGRGQRLGGGIPRGPGRVAEAG
jgi:hypothetical protein